MSPLNVLPTMTNPPGGPNSPVGIERAEVQVRQQSRAPPGAPLDGEHDEVVREHRLDLDPALAPSPGRIRRVERLDDDALVTGCERLARELLGGLGVGGDQARDAPLRRDPLQLRQPHRERLVDQVASVEVQHVEEPRPQRRVR